MLPGLQPSIRYHLHSDDEQLELHRMGGAAVQRSKRGNVYLLREGDANDASDRPTSHRLP